MPGAPRNVRKQRSRPGTYPAIREDDADADADHQGSLAPAACRSLPDADGDGAVAETRLCKMASEQERIDYLLEHLSYEVLMLRYTRQRLVISQDQLLWNALYESFGVHARNLYDFLRNEKDSRNFKASDYIDEFEVADRMAVHGLMQTMYEQLLHLGKRRTTEKAGKIDIGDVRKIAEWIEAGLRQFADEIQSPYRENWNLDSIDDSVYHLSPEPPGQSSFPVFTGTGSVGPRKGGPEIVFKKPKES